MRLLVAGAVSLVVVLAACDPGWVYRVPGGKEVMDRGRQFDVPGPSHTSLRVHASLFTSSLSTYLTITNDGPGVLEVRPDDLHMFDRMGHELHRQSDRPESVRCDRNAADVVRVAAGAACDMFVDFEVRPDADLLRTITLTHGGLKRDGVAATVRVVFEKD